MAKVFIQENDQDIIDILCIALEFEDYETYTVLGYEVDFVALIKKIRPNLAMLDYRINGDDCRRVAKIIRSSFPSLSLLASSCNAGFENEYYKYGFNGYILKPFDIDCLYQTIKHFINKAS